MKVLYLAGSKSSFFKLRMGPLLIVRISQTNENAATFFFFFSQRQARIKQLRYVHAGKLLALFDHAMLSSAVKMLKLISYTSTRLA